VDWARGYRAAGITGGGVSRLRVKSGPRSALRAMRRFLEKGLGDYSWARNDPSIDGQSGLSPYLHFGQLSAQRLALEVSRSPLRGRDDFLEQLVVRRELSDNYCLYNPHYDSFEGIPAWARKTLDKHRADIREYVYARDDLEFARTHDPLWNAAQAGLLKLGTMHGYLRMYWAKKILEWSASPEEAYETAVVLNDRYELDGRDPNGYAGIAWSIGGAHDRPWAERPVFGMVRYMSFNGCKSKFNIRRYIESIENA
jgi:deoxyribodipyrimidine photo-lyase